MRKEGRIQNFVIALFGIAIVAMSIGFAAYATTLTIGGGSTGSGSAVTIKKAWDVHYDSTATEATAETAAVASNGSITSISTTNVTFTATLNAPGDYYQFTLPVMNEGTMTAYLDSINMTALSDAQKAYLEFTIAYDGVTATNQNITGITGKSLASNATKNMVVTVTFKQTTDQSALPTTDSTVNLWAELLFEDTDNS